MPSIAAPKYMNIAISPSLVFPVEKTSKSSAVRPVANAPVAYDQIDDRTVGLSYIRTIELRTVDYREILVYLLGLLVSLQQFPKHQIVIDTLLHFPTALDLMIKQEVDSPVDEGHCKVEFGNQPSLHIKHTHKSPLDSSQP